jgi:hypothetical protein
VILTRSGFITCVCIIALPCRKVCIITFGNEEGFVSKSQFTELAQVEHVPEAEAHREQIR